MGRTASGAARYAPEEQKRPCSVARGEDEPHSDLDIAIIAPDGRVDDTVEAVRL